MTYLLTQKETGRSVDSFLCFLVHQLGNDTTLEYAGEGRKQTNLLVRFDNFRFIICHDKERLPCQDALRLRPSACRRATYSRRVMCPRDGGGTAKIVAQQCHHNSIIVDAAVDFTF